MDNNKIRIISNVHGSGDIVVKHVIEFDKTLWTTVQYKQAIILALVRWVDEVIEESIDE